MFTRGAIETHTLACCLYYHIIFHTDLYFSVRKCGEFTQTPSNARPRDIQDSRTAAACGYSMRPRLSPVRRRTKSDLAWCSPAEPVLWGTLKQLDMSSLFLESFIFQARFLNQECEFSSQVVPLARVVRSGFHTQGVEQSIPAKSVRWQFLELSLKLCRGAHRGH